MTTQEVADSLVKSCSKGQFMEATKQLYSDNIVSVEPHASPGQSREATGLAAVITKADWWNDNHDVHSVKVEGPLVAGDGFSVAFHMDVTFKPEKRRFQMSELAVYKVADGKIVHEEFFY